MRKSELPGRGWQVGSAKSEVSGHDTPRLLTSDLRLAASGLAVALFLAVGWWLCGCRGPAGPDGDNAFLPDSLPPVVQWLAPEPGVTVDTAVTLEARAWDRIGLAEGQVADTIAWRMVFFIGGYEFAGELVDTVQKSYRYHWCATRYPEAPYTLQARVWDQARNSASTPVILVWVRHQG